MKHILKKAVGAIGYRLIRPALTLGLEPLTDIKRYFPDRHVRTAVDVGANVGAFSRAIVTAWPGCRVLAFEPVASTYATLRSNVAGLPNIETVHAAAGPADSEAVLYHQPDAEWNTLNPAANIARPGAGSETVRVVRLESFLAGVGVDRIDFLKTDAEGFDLKVLQGASGLFNAGRVGVVYSEVTFDPDGWHTKFPDLCDFLMARGFRLFCIYHQTINPGTHSAGYCDAMFVNASG